MYNEWSDIQSFATTFGVKNVFQDLSRIDPQVLQFRAELIDEETVRELLPAMRKFGVSPTLENLVDVADGLVDSVYVILGAVVALELPWDELWEEVHRSNMSKVWTDGQIHRREDGKIMKPPGFKPPDLHRILMRWQEQRVALQDKPITRAETITPEEQQRLIGQWQSSGVNPTHRWDNLTKQYVLINPPQQGSSNPPVDPLP